MQCNIYILKQSIWIFHVDKVFSHFPPREAGKWSVNDSDWLIFYPPQAEKVALAGLNTWVKEKYGKISITNFDLPIVLCGWPGPWAPGQIF